MRTRNVVPLGVVAAVIACSGPSGMAPERTRTTSQAVTGELSPVPCTQTVTNGVVTGTTNDWQGTNPTWQGTKVQLAVADAWTACSFVPVTTSQATPVLSGGVDEDLYLATIRAHVDAALSAYCSANNDVGTCSESAGGSAQDLYYWYNMRKDPAWSCDPTTLAPTSGVDLAAGPQHASITEGLDLTLGISLEQLPAATVANQDIRTAALNLCIATTLRDLSPGASGPAALLYTDADQRELLEVIRERAQIAMLQYALLGEAFAFNASPPAAAPAAAARLDFLHQWATTEGAGDLTSMGKDFGTAIQLHSITTEELAQLMSRSASARTPTSNTPPATPADGQWSSGSWKQRLFAMLHGGDPLAVVQGGPWTSFASTPGTLTGFDWPILPYITTTITEPQVMQLLNLAQRYDAAPTTNSSARALTLVSISPSNCATDPNATATNLYNVVEANQEVADCVALDTTGNCTSTLPTVVPSHTSSQLLRTMASPSPTLRRWQDISLRLWGPASSSPTPSSTAQWT